MKSILIIAALFAASIASAQTKAVLKNINGGTITESLTIGSGKTLTIASGATINATGATITGFGSGGGPTALDDLTDATITTVATNDFFVKGAGGWVNLTPTNARTAMGLGSLATQSGTFSGTSSGTNTGDQDLSAYLTSATAASTYQAQTLWLASLNTAAGAAPNAVLNADGLGGFAATETGAAGFALLAAADATALRTAVLPSKSANGGKFLRVNAGATDYELATISGGGDALTTNTLAQFAATTSAQLTGILSDESGTGVILTTTGSAANLTNFPTLNQNTSGNAATVTTNANLTGPVTSTGNATAIANGAISNAMLANGAVANLSGTNTGDQSLAAYLTSATASSTYQPLDSDLTSIAALVTTAAGLALLDDADASAQRTTLGLSIGTDVQAYSASTSLLGSSIDLSTEITGTLALANGGTGAALTDPNADRIAFWDDSAGVMTWLTAGSGLTIAGTTITASGGGGSAPQPVQAVLTTTATTTSTTYADITGLTASYTPTSVTQKVLVRGSVSIGSTSSNQAALRLARDGTALTVATASGSRTVAHVSFFDTANGLGMETATFEFLDTPGTTSSVTYSIQWKLGGSSGTCYLNRAQDDGDYDTRANTVSTLTIIPFAE